jgi:hypothetical protein
MTRTLTTLALLSAGCTTACSTNGAIDLTMRGVAHPPPHGDLRVGDRRVLAGDLHCHVLPPDAPYHVSRELPETLALAEREGLDFVVLTPHVPARFFADPGERDWVLRTQDELRTRLAALAPKVLVVPGFEYTDHRWGHVGAGFAEVREILSEVSVDDARARPELFFERFVARGGVLTINHPVEQPIGNFGPLAWDLSWRGLGRRDAPPEIAWITAHAQTVETYNVMVSNLRDRLFFGDEDRSLRESWHITEDLARDRGERVTPVGGTDSHGFWIRPTTYVVANERTATAIGAAIAAGRTCVRGPDACTLEVRAPGGDWHGVGDAIGQSPQIEARAGRPMTLIVNGEIVAHAAAGEIAHATIAPDRCSFVRAISGASWSAPVYVGCPFQ